MDKKKVSSKLTKSEMAALDFLIADAQERGEKSIVSPAGIGRDLIREVMRQGVREVVRQVVRRLMGGSMPQGKPIKREDVDKAFESLNEEPSLDELIELRKQLEDIVK